METRSTPSNVEIRTGPNGPMIVGYGVVYNSDSADMGFIEQVDPGALTKTLREADVRALGNHDVNWLLGRSKSGTLRLNSDPRGVYYEIDVNEADPDGQRAIEKVRRRDWDGSSFSFQTVRDEWDWAVTPPQRRLLEVKLIDIGPVTFNAYPAADAMARALEPIAKRSGYAVETLVSAMQRGEIRSMMTSTTGLDDEPPPAEVRADAPTPEPEAPDAVEAEIEDETFDTDARALVEAVEARAGKMISAATREILEGAVKSIRDLLDTGLEDELPGDDDEEAERSLHAYRAMLDVRERELVVLRG